MFVRTVAAEVRGHDTHYEVNLKEREKNNPKYGFLTNKHVSFAQNWVASVIADDENLSAP